MSPRPCKKEKNPSSTPFATCLTKNGQLVLSRKAETVIWMHGMISGEVDVLIGTMDALFRRALYGASRVLVVINASGPGFRVPCQKMRIALKHMRKYEQCIDKILFVRLPLLSRYFLSVAKKVLHEDLSSMVEVAEKDSDLLVYLEDVPSSFGGDVVFSEEDIFKFRTSTFSPPPSFLTAREKGGEGSLGMKRGNGGRFGSTSWKRKRFFLDSDSSLFYTDDKPSSSYQNLFSLREVSLLDASFSFLREKQKEDGSVSRVCISTPSKEVHLKLETEFAAQVRMRILSLRATKEE